MMTDGRSAEAMRAAKTLTDAELSKLPLSDPSVANMEAWLGNLYLRVGRYQDAYHWTHLALLHRNEHLPPHAMPIGDAYMQLAKVFLESGEAASAEVQLERAAEIFRIAGESGKTKAIAVQEQWAGLCLMQGRLSEAERRYDTMMVAQAALLGNQHPDLAQTLNNMGGVYIAQGRMDKALGVYDHALQMQTATLGPDALPLATTCTNLGVLHDQEMAYEEAELQLKRAYAIRQKKLQLNDPLLLLSLDNLVSFYLKREAFAKAEALLLEARQVRERTLGGDTPAVAEIMDRYATLYMAVNQAAVAEQFWLKALQIRENSLGSQNEEVAANLYNLGKLENILRKNEQARIHLNWARDIYEYQTIGNEAQLTAILSELFMCDYLQGKMDDAEENLLLMYTIKAEVYGPKHPETLAVMEEQVKFYEGIGWDGKAEAVSTDLLARRGSK